MSQPIRFTIEELAEIVRCEAIGTLSYCITGVEDLEHAGPGDAAFLENPLYQKQLAQTKAGLVVIHPKMARVEGVNYLLSKTPSLTFQTLLELFIPPIPSAFTGIHPTAVIASAVKLGKGVTVGPHVVIDQGCEVGEFTTLSAGVFLGAQVKVGSHSHLHPHVVVREGCLVGNRVVIQSGSVIGSCGFGYHTDGTGKHTHLKQLGHVVIEDDVEIGANTTIDRARFRKTLIKRGSKIDNLVQIGHQVEVGEDNLIVAQVGISGSTKMGRNVVVGGQSGLAGHIEIADQVILAARSGVSKSITESGTYMGAPVMPRKEFTEHFIEVRNIKKLSKRIAELEKKSADIT